MAFDSPQPQGESTESEEDFEQKQNTLIRSSFHSYITSYSLTVKFMILVVIVLVIVILALKVELQRTSNLAQFVSKRVKDFKIQMEQQKQTYDIKLKNIFKENNNQLALQLSEQIEYSFQEFKNQLQDLNKLQYSVTEEKVQTTYTSRTVTTFKGDLPISDILNLENEQEIKKFLKKFKMLKDKAYDLYKHPHQLLALESQYYELDQKYSIGKYTTQLPICIVAPGRNLFQNSQELKLLESINNQNYTNYHLFLIDDASTDGTYDVLKKNIKKFPRLRTRTTLIKNQKQIGALGNKFLTVFHQCQEGSIVFDVDSDDSLIGRQTMKLMNALYQSSDHWFIYSNSILSKMKPFLGISQPIKPQILANNSYRQALYPFWVTNPLRTYLRDLYVKIPKQYFFESENKFYPTTSDRFEIFAIVELAGPQHIKSIPELLYNNKFFSYSLCEATQIAYYDMVARNQIPLLPLNSLNDQAKKTKNYVIPQNLHSKLRHQRKKKLGCSSKGMK